MFHPRFPFLSSFSLSPLFIPNFLLYYDSRSFNLSYYQFPHPPPTFIHPFTLVFIKSFFPLRYPVRFYHLHFIFHFFPLETICQHNSFLFSLVTFFFHLQTSILILYLFSFIILPVSYPLPLDFSFVSFFHSSYYKLIPSYLFPFIPQR